MNNQKAFTVGSLVMWQCPITKNIYQDEIVYLSAKVVGGRSFDLSYLYEKGKLTKVNK